MKNEFLRYYQNPTILFIYFVLLIIPNSNILKAEESYLKEIEINTSTKFDDKSSDLPTNPFEIVEMIRRANSLNNATNPSDAIDDALKSFDMIDEKEKL